MVILESMANKLPVICLDSGGPGYNIDCKSGFKVNPNQQLDKIIEDFINYINYINCKENTESVQKIIEEAYKRVNDDYSWENKAKYMQKIYEELIK